MNINKFFQKIMNNWKEKIICIVVALLIYVFHMIASLDHKNYIVPLEIKQNGNLIVCSDLTPYKFIKVSVRGKAEHLASISENDFKVYVDISSIVDEGEVESSVMVECAERLLEMDPLEISCKPDNIKLKLEQKIISYVPVKPSITGSPAYGYEMVVNKITPDSVGVIGPKSQVEKIESVTTSPVSINAAVKDITQKVSLVNLNSFIKYEETSPYEVYVEIKSLNQVKRFSAVPVVVENLKSNLSVISEPYFVDLTLEGSVVDIEKLNLSQIKVFVDCAEIESEGEITLPVIVNYPLSTKLVTQSIASATIKFSLLEEEHEETEPLAETDETDLKDAE